jgi:hypothetical protein
MAFVIGRLAPAGGAEGLAGTGACPNRSVVVISSETEGEAPAANPCEEMALPVASEVVGPNIDN